MSRPIKKNNYNAGDTVYAKSNPKLKLVVRRYIDQVYYCKVEKDPEQKERVYFERELVENPTLIAENRNSNRWENEGGGIVDPLS